MQDLKLTIPGYHFYDMLYESSRSIVYRATRDADQRPVVIKLLKSAYPSFSELLHFRNQYTLTKDLQCPGIVSPIALEHVQNQLALIMEDSGAIALKEHLKQQTMTLERFFPIALALADIVRELYQHQLIHKDIKPQNILIHPKTHKIQLIDFHIATLLPKESAEMPNLNVLQGTLSYISPEQTGRMNRHIDYRTDFYSLGVTFYEMLTEQLPFQSDDALEIIHCHMAKAPPPLIKHRPTLPNILNDLVLKLMAKNAEERYQSADGLRADLQKCATQWLERQQIEAFTLGLDDIATHFHIPDKLYGRKAQVNDLLSAFDRISEGATELVTVTGLSGIGKTALIHEIHKPIVSERGYFIQGKCDQCKRNTPFSAITQALRMLLQQLLSETQQGDAPTWKNDILAALGNNAQVIIELIPELELLIGKQPPVPTLQGNATQNRLHIFFQKFLQVFTITGQPIVIFLDDLQWIDAASCQLLPTILQQTEQQKLLLIGAYRDNEVTPGHALALTLETLTKSQTPMHRITLPPLNATDITQWVSDTLHASPQQSAQLGVILLQKTKGNPFFCHQLLRFLHEDGLITFDHAAGCWHCDTQQAERLAASDNIVDFLTDQLKKLPKNTQTALQLAACIGHQFDLSTLAIVSKRSIDDTAADIWIALQKRFIIPQDEAYPSYRAVSPTQIHSAYKFLHDHIQQAVVGMITAEEKTAIHLFIGRLLKQHSEDSTDNEQLFACTNQLNLGATLMTDQHERDTLAECNRQAGDKAKASTAYTAAGRYYQQGISLLTADSWQTHYRLTLSLHERAAEAAFLAGDFAQQETLHKTILDQAQCLQDSVKTQQIQCLSLIAQNKLRDAIDTALPVLKQFGVCFPEHPGPEDFTQSFARTQAAWRDKPIAALLDLPTMTAAKPLAAMQLLATIASPSYLAMPALMPLIVLKQIQLSVDYGNTLESIQAYASQGIILGGVMGDIEAGHAFGQIAIALLNRRQNKKSLASAYTAVFSAIQPWKNHLSDTRIPLLKSYQCGLETGDLHYATASAYYHCLYGYFSGQALHELCKEADTYAEASHNLQQSMAIHAINILRQSALNLLDNVPAPEQLQGIAYNEREMLPAHQQSNNRYILSTLHLHKLMLAYLFARHTTAIEQAKLTEQHLDGVVGTINVAVFHFYDSLARLAVAPNLTADALRTTLEKVNDNQKKLQRWAEHAPMNFQHKWHLVEAERHHVHNQFVAAADQYDLAITGAHNNHYVQEEALANELTAKFYLDKDKPKIAQVYMTDAYYAYARWGAQSKITDLETRYPELLAPILNHSVFSKPRNSLSTSITEQLDLTTVIKASHTLSGELSLPALLEKLLDFAMENAGAQRCVLLLNNQGHWTIEGESLLVPEKTHTLPALPLAESTELPITLLQHVIRKQQALVLDDAQHDNQRFHDDPYFIRNKALKSILCMPIHSHAKLIGLLYLENALTIGAFHTKRLELLKMLSAQAAISLENAGLYENLEEKVQLRTKELKAAQDELVRQAHEAGMAEMAIGVMHNIGNALTPAKVEASTTLTMLQESPFRLYLAEALAALPEVVNHTSILTEYEKNRLAQIVKILPQSIQEEYDKVIAKLQNINDRHLHIEDIIQLQMRYAQAHSNHKRLNFNDLVKDALRILENTLHQYNIDITTEYAASATLHAEENKLLQVLINIIKNSCEAMQTVPIDHRQLMLTTATEVQTDQPDMLMFSAQDNGIGFNEEGHAQLFNFGYTTKKQGSGFGLHACANYLIAQKGRIEAYSEGVNQGAKFTIRLPIQSNRT